MGVLRAK